MDARPSVIAIIIILIILFAIPSCNRQSVSPGLPNAPTGGLGGGGAVPAPPTSTPVPPAPTQAAPVAGPSIPTPTFTPVSPAPTAVPQGGGASTTVVPTAVVAATPSPSIPTPTAIPADNVICNQRLVHVVAPGENLYRIALRYRMSVEGLARLNNLWDPGYIRAGQRLQIQTCYAVRSYGWWVWERASYVPPANPAPISDSGIYIVQQGDNLFRIAVKFNTSVKDLVTANGLVNESVSVGQRLFVP